MPRYARSAPLALLLLVTILLSGWPPVELRARPLRVSQVQQTITPEECTRLATQRQLYLPLIVGNSNGVATAAATPAVTPATADSDFTIISPANGITVAGTTLFTIQPAGSASIVCAGFRAGNMDLGTDLTPDDGLQVFLDTGTLPAGSNTLTASAVGVSGSVTTKSITITNVPNPPASTAVGPEGATLGTESGSTIVIPPSAVDSATSVTLRERTQAEVTAESGIEWDDLGVTFLGDIQVQSDTPLSRPVGISTVGFANRIQPGQAVVTYNLLPDQDGDGIGELVVVNGAEVAPNGTIVSAAVPEITIETITVGQSGIVLAQTDAISGPPGTLIRLETEGFNPFSSFGNVAVFRSMVDGSEIAYPGMIVPTLESDSATKDQEFVTVIPFLPTGTATLVLRNENTGMETEPVIITINEPAPLSAPAKDIISDFLDYLPQILDDLKGNADLSTLPMSHQRLIAEQETALSQAIANFRTEINRLDETDADEQAFLNILATMLDSTDIATIDQIAGRGIHLTNGGAASVGAAIGAIVGGVAVAANSATAGAAIAGALGTVVSGSAIGAAIAILGGILIIGGVGFLVYTAIGGISNAIFGMGAAPPPGGNGGGNVTGGSPDGGVQLQQTGGLRLEPGRYTIKVFPRGGGAALSPFTGATDAGGYFFLPFIPEGEPFTAVAVDKVTGVLQTFDGVGPATGESVYMFFDFSEADDIEPVFPSASNVLAEFDFNNNTEDSSGNNRDAVLIGGDFVPTFFGIGLQVGGTSNSGIDWSDHASLLVHPYTIEMILTPQQTSSWRKLFSFDDSKDAGWYYRSEGIQAYPNAVIGSGQVKPGELHYLAFVSTALDQIDVYFQGELLGSTNASFTAPPVQAIFFKDDTATGGENLEATIEALRISDVARTSDEIAAVQQVLTRDPSVTVEAMHNK
jgi:hypothetical protein